MVPQSERKKGLPNHSYSIKILEKTVKTNAIDLDGSFYRDGYEMMVE